MSWLVSIRPAAQDDLRQARAWYEMSRPGLEDEFLVAIADALERLEEDPKRFPIYYRGFRRVLTGRFPYKVFYRIEGDKVIVFRVLHGARDHTRQIR